jgi:hypothetical protein
MTDDLISPQGGTSDSGMLRLILSSVQTQGEKMVEIRIELNTMRGEIRELQKGQNEQKTDAKDRAAWDRSSALSMSNTAKTEDDTNANQHKEIWDAVNKLSSWIKAVSIAASILVTILSILTIVLQIVR